MKIMGIDLAGKEENPTGICILKMNGKISLHTLYDDGEILEKISQDKPSLIVVDAPLSLPKGRCCLEKECECAVGGHFRQSEREIRRYGPVLPLTFTGMKMLTMRGVGLAEAMGRAFKGRCQLKETHPRTVQKILGFEDLKRDLGEYFQMPRDSNEHELDALLAALTGFFYLQNCSLELGDRDEGTIIIPQGRECLQKLKE